MDDVRARLAGFPDTIVTIGMPSFVGGQSSDIELEIAGDDLDTLDRIVLDLEQRAGALPGILDPDTTARIGKPELRVRPSRPVLGDLKAPATGLGMALRANLEGLEAGTFKRDARNYDIVVKLAEREGQDQVAEFLFSGKPGHPLVLADLGEVETKLAPIQVMRKDKRRIAKLFANLGPELALGPAVTQIGDVLESDNALPLGYDYQVAGHYEIMAEAQAEFGEAGIIAVVLVILTLAAILESFKPPVLILVTIPLSLVGVFWALRLAGTSMEIFVLMGLVMLVGIVVNNAILIMDQFNVHVSEGMPRHTAMVSAACERLRPIVMITLAAVLGMLPPATKRGQAPTSAATGGSPLRSVTAPPIPRECFSDFSTAELLEETGWEPMMNGALKYSRVPSRHNVSGGWAWLHGRHALGIFKYSQECMEFSVVSKLDEQTLRLGGACTISREPAALTRLGPERSVDLGVTRYETVSGGYEEAAYAFRRMLDEHDCRFPKDYNPPVHWEQLYDMSGAWSKRAEQYTKANLEKEAEKGRLYSCESLYLDPDWDTKLASLIWDEARLGPRKQFIDQMRSEYGLAVSLHTPLATWMSSGILMGPSSLETWPAAARRTIPESVEITVPTKRGGCRNLALLPVAQPSASSVYSNGQLPIHQIDHLNDGWCGNSASWIAGEMPCWAEIDLGGEHQINEVVLGNEHFQAYTDRAAGRGRRAIAG